MDKDLMLGLKGNVRAKYVQRVRAHSSVGLVFVISQREEHDLWFPLPLRSPGPKSSRLGLSFTILKIAFIWIIDITHTVIWIFTGQSPGHLEAGASCSHASAVTEGQRFVHMCYRISHQENTITPKMSADTERGPNWRLLRFCYSLINWCGIFHPNCRYKALWWNSHGSLLNFIFTISHVNH